jgi:VanZ family protein
LKILQDGFATLNRLEFFLIKHKPSDFLQRLTVSVQNFFMSLSVFLRFYSLLSLATKRSCFATYKRALRNFFGNGRFIFSIFFHTACQIFDEVTALGGTQSHSQ